MQAQTLFKTTTLGPGLDVAAHLKSLRACKAAYDREDAALGCRARELDRGTSLGRQQLAQIRELRHRIKTTLVGAPMVVDPVALASAGGFSAVRETLQAQYARLTTADRRMWLNTLLFIVTPDLYTVIDKVRLIREDICLGAQRNLLVGGRSGLGKSTLLDWYAACLGRRVERERNHIPCVKVDAPDSKNAPKALYERLLLEYGAVYLKGQSGSELRTMLMGNVEQCGTSIVIVDEVENIAGVAMKKHFVDLCNALRGIPIICASCNPREFVGGPDSNEALQGRFRDCVDLEPYTGERLGMLLTLIDLLLPFGGSSNLGNDLVARMIEDRTGGTLRDIMPLIRTASRAAVDRGLPNVPPSLLEETWGRMKAGRVDDPA